MSYQSIAQMAGDPYLRDRETACAATEDLPDPVAWAQAHAWTLAASPGWAEAWDAALAGDVPTPGADPAVISDAMILAAVQATVVAAGG